MRTKAEILAEIDRLRAEVEGLEPAPEERRSTRRQAIRLAGASAAVAVVGAAVNAQPAAAADPNDVVKNAVNVTTGTTTITGSFGNEILRVENTATTGRAIYAKSGQIDVGAVRGDNLNADGIGGIGVAGYAPGGRDFFAFGSGRIAMNPHNFSIFNNSYLQGEIHQLDGTFWGMVGTTTRRSIVGPNTAGALYPINPVRVYDSRRPAPNPGKLQPGTSRVISVASARDLTTGAVTVANVVPTGATAVVFNLAVTGGDGNGYLSLTAGNVATASASILNYTAGQTISNASIVALDTSRQVRVHGNGGPVHVILDISGYYL